MIKPNKKPKVLKVKAPQSPSKVVKEKPVVFTGTKQITYDWEKDFKEMEIQLLWAKVRANRKQLIKEHGRKFVVWYDQQSKLPVIEKYRKDYLEWLVVKRKENQLKIQNSDTIEKSKKFAEGMLTISEFETLTEPAKTRYFKKHNDPHLHAFYIMGGIKDYQKHIEPTPINLERFFNAQKQYTEIEKQQREKFWNTKLTDGQFFLIATTTPEGETPKYMGKPLSNDLMWEYRKYKLTNTGYIEHLKKVERIKKLRDNIEKPFKPLKKVMNDYQEIGRRLRKSMYLPEMELFSSLKENLPEFEVVKEGLAKRGVRPKGDFTVTNKFMPEQNYSIEAKSDGTLRMQSGQVTVVSTPANNNDSIKKISEVRQHGFNEYADRNDLTNIYEFPEHFLANNEPYNFDYEVKGYEDSVALSLATGLHPFDLFKATCDIIKKKRSTLEYDKQLHTGLAIQEIMDYWENQVASAKSVKYTPKRLFESKFFKDWCAKHKLQQWFKSYQRFNEKWEGITKVYYAKATKRNTNPKG